MMGDLKTRLLPLFRRSSTTSSAKSSSSSTSSVAGDNRDHSKASLLLFKSASTSCVEPVYEQEDELSHLPILPQATEDNFVRGHLQQTPDTSLESPRPTPIVEDNPKVTLEEPTPDLSSQQPSVINDSGVSLGRTAEASATRPDLAPRRQSLAHSSQSRFIKTLLESENPKAQAGASDYFGGPPTISANMLQRKIWVKRPGASATLVLIREDDLVDDVRDMILKKYANSLGRNFDAPDVTLRVIPRDHSHRHSQGERTLGPEEPITRTLDHYFPGGQNVEEALIIDIPQRRTPRHSPRTHMPYYLAEDLRPGESGTEYFPQMPAAGQPSPLLPANLSVTSGGPGSHHPSVHSMSIVNTGQPPPLPSPSIRGPRLSHRPVFPRKQTTSPTVHTTTSGNQSQDSLKAHPGSIPVPPPMPSPPIPSETQPRRVASPPPPRVSSPRPRTTRQRGPKKPVDQKHLPAGLLDGSVPPINVLIVEDNIINLKLLEAFMKRLKVRWHTAMNGREAVTKWRAGGFHLVLMDIQLPVMNGLEATKEIRRLERFNNIGVISNSTVSTPTSTNNAASQENDRSPDGEDILVNTGLFKSPVIIVALTASSLQSDRHEALAAGCNDFLTKPVNFVWLERKVMEWGCMQALIDFDGWRKWRDFSQTQSPTNAKDSAKGGAKSLLGKGFNGKVGGINNTTVAKKDKRLSSGASILGAGSGSEGLEAERDEGRGKPIAAGA